MTSLGLNIILYSNPQNIAEVEPFIQQAFKDCEINETFFGNILISITEAVSNAIIHGNHADFSKKVQLSYILNAGKITFTIQDEGHGFNPHNLPDPTSPENLLNPGGRGVFLMNQLADNVIFLEGGRLVQLEFVIR